MQDQNYDHRAVWNALLSSALLVWQALLIAALYINTGVKLLRKKMFFMELLLTTKDEAISAVVC